MMATQIAVAVVGLTTTIAASDNKVGTKGEPLASMIAWHPFKEGLRVFPSKIIDNLTPAVLLANKD